MKPLSPDTEPWAEEMQIELFRKASPARRYEIGCQLSAFVWNAARARIDALHPEETQDERDLRFLREVYDEKIARDFIAYRRKVLGPRDQRGPSAGAERGAAPEAQR